MGFVRGATIALNAGDNSAVLDFYREIFGRGPDTTPMDNFLEWQVAPGIWLQVSTGHARPGGNTARVRFETNDIHTAVARMQAFGVPVGEIVVVPDMVSFANFSDHWGNALGFYQLLSPRPVMDARERRAYDAHYASPVEYEPDVSAETSTDEQQDVADATGEAMASRGERTRRRRQEGRGRWGLRRRAPRPAEPAVLSVEDPRVPHPAAASGLLDEVMYVGHAPGYETDPRSASQPLVDEAGADNGGVEAPSPQPTRTGRADPAERPARRGARGRVARE